MLSIIANTQIVHLYEAISVPNADALYLVLEYLPGGVIMSVKMGDDSPSEPPFPDTQAREYFRQLILGLEYLHANGVIHRDVRFLLLSLLPLLSLGTCSSTI